MNALSLDMGGTHIACAVVKDGEVLAKESISPESTLRLAPLMPEIEATLHRLIEKSRIQKAHCAGLAIGYPGVVDFRTGSIYATFKKYEDAPELDLGSWSRKLFGLPMRMESDARMALLGEWYAGAAKGFHDVVIMTLGTGIGGAAMMHGRLVRGRRAQAGSLGGHFPIQLHGRPCVCGNLGCAEAEAAGWSLPMVVREWPGFASSSLAPVEHIGFRELFEHADRGDAVALAVQQRCFDVWGANALANVTAYEPQVIVLGGGVMRSAARIVPAVQRYVNEHGFAAFEKPEVRAARLGNDAGLLGAVPLLAEEGFAA